MHGHSSDPTGRTAGQYARATVRRLRMRTLVIARRAGRGDGAAGPDVRPARPGASSPRRSRCWCSMFVISRYVLPLLERRDRGRHAARSRSAACWTSSRASGWRVIHDVTLGRGNVDHIADRPGRACSRSRRRAIPGRFGWDASTAHAEPGAGAAPGDRAGDGRERGAADRVQPRLGRQAAGARARACACCPRGCWSDTSNRAAGDGSRRRRSSRSRTARPALLDSGAGARSRCGQRRHAGERPCGTCARMIVRRPGPLRAGPRAGGRGSL